MVARDDSVIRGSLIASLIILVLSLALNFFFWKWGNTQALDSEAANQKLTTVNESLRKMDSQNQLMKAMLGKGEVSEASFALLRESVGGDADMESIEQRFVQDMAYFGPEVDIANRNYTYLPEFLVNAIRARNDQYGQAREEVATMRTQADSDVDNARKAQQEAEKTRDGSIAKLDQSTIEFNEDRDKMKKAGEETRDSLNRNVSDFQKFRKLSTDEKTQLLSQSVGMKSTIETQRQELNRLRSDKFEYVQGEIQYVVPPGELVLINLGSSDSLRAGVQFGVIAADAMNLQEAPVKATVEVIKVLNANSSQARVIGSPSYRNPLIAGDKIYSPFWAPGRKVRIALAGDIDIDGDGRSDIDQLRSMIELADAEVAAVITSSGALEGKLDSSVRFLVVGEQPDLGNGSTEASEQNAQLVAKLGEIKAKAIELGVTVIPAWKLQAYLKTINDSVTTPLGSAVRGEDFPPEAIRSGAGRGNNEVLSEIYRNQVEGQ